MAQRATLGVDEAMRLLPETCARYQLSERDTGILSARLLRYNFVPPPRSVAEVSLCITRGAPGSPPGSRVARVTGGKGHYPDLPEGAICPMQIDLMYSEPAPLDFTNPTRPRCPDGSTLFVVDYKFGDDSHVDPVDRNAQLAHAAVAAAEWTGAQSVVPAIAYPGPGDGDWDVPTDATGEIVAWDRDRIELEYAKAVTLYDARTEEAKRLAAGEAPRVVEGSHCAFCRSWDSCPAKLALVRAVVDPAGSAALVGPAPLTDEQARMLVAALRVADVFMRKARTAIETHVRVRKKPIELGDGLLWGPVIVEQDEIDPARAEDILREELGEFRFEAMAVTKSGLERAMTAKHETEGKKRQRAPAMRHLFGRLRASEAMTKVAREEYRAYRPAPTLPEADGPGELEAALAASVKVEE